MVSSKEVTLSLSGFSCVRPIARGAFGQIFECLHTQSAERVAIKHISNVFFCHDDCKSCLREVLLHRQLAHSNIVQLHSVRRGTGSKWSDLYLVLELAETDLKGAMAHLSSF